MKKKTVKKLLSVSLVSAMTVVLLAGCGGGSDSGDSGSDEGGSGDGKTLKVAAFEGGNGADIWEKITAAFEEEFDCEVELELSSELDQVLTKEIQNGDVPDVVYYNLGQESGFTETMLKEKAVADISDVFDDELKGKMVEGILDGTAAQPYGDGKIYLAPIFYTQTYPQPGYFDATMYAMLAQAGGTDFYNNALTYDENTWTSDEGKKVLDTIATLVSSDNLWADTVSNANTDGGFKVNQQAVIDGDALFMPNGSWVVGEMANSTPDDYEWGVMGVPKWSADESQSVYTFTEQMWIPADAPNIDLAKEFIKFMYSDTVVDLCLANKTTNAETGEESDAPIVVPVQGAAEKLPEGVIKTSFQTGDDVVAVTGTWATTAPIEGLDMKGSVYGAIDSVSTGDMSVDEWQEQLVDVWSQCADAME